MAKGNMGDFVQDKIMPWIEKFINLKFVSVDGKR